MHKTRVVVGMALLLVVMAGLLWPLPWLTVRHDGRLWAAYPGGEHTRFALRWRHSVEEEDWIERFRVVGSEVQVAATRFKTFGAGVPAHAGTRTSLEHGWVVMSGIDRDVDPLTVQAAAAENYRFRYQHGPWQRLSGNGQAPILVFAGETAPLYRILPTLVATAWRGVRSRT